MDQESADVGVRRSRPLWVSHGVAIPEEIEVALRRDELVIFCGAGVSMAAPSNLPGFRQLVLETADGLGRRNLIPDEPNAPVRYDVIMGQLDRIARSVHASVRSRISAVTRPNDYHEDLLRIAGAHRATPRIVTTNFDRLFEKTSEFTRAELDTWCAPSLPRGNDFAGIVHLHGRDVVEHVGERLVVTDEDFGAAYITEGWATEFVTQLFARYTILFVGYSADDTVMQYLARALPVGAHRRYAVMVDDDNRLLTQWAHLGVEVVPYPRQPHAKNEHAALGGFVHAWANRLTRSAGAVFDEAQAVVKAGPEASHNNLLWLLHESDFTRHFLQLANPTEWAAHPAVANRISPLFDTSNVERSSLESQWADWLSLTLLNQDDSTVLEAINAHGGGLSTTMWFNVWLRVRGGFQDTARDRHLVLLLIANRRSGDETRLAALLQPIAVASPLLGEVLLHALLQSTFTAVRATAFLADAETRVAMTVPLYTYGVLRGWAELRPRLRDHAPLLGTLIGVLRTTELTEGLNAGYSYWSGRTVWPFDLREDRRWRRDDWSAVVLQLAHDLMRDDMQRNGPSQALVALGSSSTIVRRLGLDVLLDDPAAQSKVLMELLRHDLIGDHSTHAEVRRILPSAYAAAQEEAREAFVRAVLQANLDDQDDIYRAYRQLELLESAYQQQDQQNHVTSIDPARVAAEDIRRRYPDLPAIELSNGSTFEIGASAVELPKATGVWRALSPLEVAAQLVSTSPNDELSWEKAAELDDYVSRRPSGRTDLLEAFADRRVHSVQAWSVTIVALIAQARDWTAAEILAALDSSDGVDLSELADALSARLFWRGTEPVSDCVTERMRLAAGLWKRSAAKGDNAPRFSSAGVQTGRDRLALEYTDACVRHAENGTIRNEQKAQLEEFVQATLGTPADPTGYWVYRRAAMLRRADVDWFDQTLLPPLQGTGTTSGAVLWGGLLDGRISEGLARRTADWFRNGAADLVDSMGPDRRLLQYHALFFLNDAITVDEAWPNPFLASAGAAVRAEWIRTLAWSVSDRPLPERLYRWWERRVQGEPPLVQEEQRALLTWLVLPEIDTHRAGSLFRRGPAVEIDDPDDPFGATPDLADLLRRDASSFLDVAGHLLTSAERLPSFVPSLVKQLQSEVGDFRTQQIWESLLRLGLREARDRLH